MTFKNYWKNLWTIKTDYDVEQYYDEILSPLFKEIAQNIENVKVIPTYDTRCHSAKQYKNFKCITNEKKRLVWPDYIFAPTKYTHANPLSPYIKVEFKRPNITKLKDKRMLYYSIHATANSLNYKRFENEIKSELSSCPLILTDGLTWLFLKADADFYNIESEKNLSALCFLDKSQPYYNGYYVSLISNAENQFETLKKEISAFIKNNSK